MNGLRIPYKTERPMKRRENSPTLGAKYGVIENWGSGHFNKTKGYNLYVGAEPLQRELLERRNSRSIVKESSRAKFWNDLFESGEQLTGNGLRLTSIWAKLGCACLWVPSRSIVGKATIWNEILCCDMFACGFANPKLFAQINNLLQALFCNCRY